METRQHPRIQLPFEVEVAHPIFGRVRTIARDISESGLFIQMPPGALKEGSKLKVTILNAALIEHTPTPTVELEVARVADEGLGLRFINQTGRHLWQSVERMRQELAIGRDYFQVFQAGLIVNREAKLLVAQQHGRWLFPGDFLVVGDDWAHALTTFLANEFGLEGLVIDGTVQVDSGPERAAVEGATFSVFHRLSTTSTRAQLRPESRYRHLRWVGRVAEVEELSFSHSLLRDLALHMIDQLSGTPTRVAGGTGRG
jgi:PilZ domain